MQNEESMRAINNDYINIYRCFYIENKSNSAWLIHRNLNEEFKSLQINGWDITNVDKIDNGYLIIAKQLITKENKNE